MIFSIKPQIFELKCVFSYFRLKTHITLLLPVYVHSWEQRKLGEVFNFHYGDGNNNPSNGGQYPVFGAGGIQGRYTKYNAENSIIIGHMGDAGCVSWGEGKHFVTYNGTITTPKDDVFTAKFGYYLLLNMNLRKYRGGSGLPFLTYDMLTEMETKCPNSKIETQEIADYFTQLDHLITLHQCKCQIDGCRFQSPLAITWEQRKVTEIGKIYIGLVTTMTKHYTDEGTLLIRNSDIKDGKFEFGDNPIYLEKTFAEKNETRMHQIGDVITVHTGDVGTSAVITENEAKSIGFATIVTRPNPKIIDSNYLCSFLNTDKHKKWAVSISTGDGRTNYNLGDYFELVVPVPSIAEQKKIASYIQKLNRLITLHQCE